MVNKVSTAFEFNEEGRGLDGIINRLELTETSVKDVASAVSAMADEIHADMQRSQSTADLFADKLGPEFMAKTQDGEKAIEGLIAKLRGLGFTYDQIEADSDALVAAIRKVDDIKLDGAQTGAHKTAGEVDKLSDSARGANSALANMIGNSAQDLGALSGVAGSAGVALGQMAEYASDAAVGGEALGSALKSMALVAGPIAALTLGVQAISWWLNRGKESQKELEDATKGVVEALRQANEQGKGLAEGLDESAKTVTEKLLEGLGGKSQSVVASLKSMRVEYADIVKAFRDGDGPLVDALTRYDELDVRLKNQNVALPAYNGLLEEQARKWGVSTDAAQQQIDTMSQLNDVFGSQIDVHQRASTAAQVVVDYTNQQTAATKYSTEAADRYVESLGAMSDARRDAVRETIAHKDAEAAYREQARGVADEYEARGAQVLADKAAADAVAADAAQRHADAESEVAAAMERRKNATLDLIGGDIAVRASQRDAAKSVADLNAYIDEQNTLSKDQRDSLDVVAGKLDATTQAQLRAAQSVADYQAQQAAANGQVLTTQQQIDLQVAALQAQADKLTGPVRDALLGYITELENVPRTVTTDINAIYTTNVDRPAFVGPHAQGGPTRKGGVYEVAEYGRPEVYTTRDGRKYMIGGDGHVTPIDGEGGTAGVAARVPVSPIGGSGGMSLSIGALNVYPVTGEVAPAAVVDAIAEYIRENGAYWLAQQLELTS